MTDSRQLTDLTPAVEMLAKAFISACEKEGIHVLITSTYRDKATQDKLYAQGRTAPGKRVTNAKGGQSYHNYRVAFDFVPIVNGKAVWNDTKLFHRCGKIAEQCGLEWAGNWRTFKELAHCQATGGKTIAQLQKEFPNGA